MPPYSFPTVSLPGPVTAIKKEIRRRIILNLYEDRGEKEKRKYNTKRRKV